MRRFVLSGLAVAVVGVAVVVSGAGSDYGAARAKGLDALKPMQKRLSPASRGAHSTSGPAPRPRCSGTPRRDSAPASMAVP